MKTKKHLSTILALVIILSMLPTMAFAAEPGLGNFRKTNTYTAGQFADVPATWYTEYVQAAYEYGLVKGSSETTFSPSGDITLAETIALACRLHSIYNAGDAQFSQQTPWYQVYVDYAAENGIIEAGTFADYNAKATRAQFAGVMSAALPETALTAINTIEDGKIPDVPANAAYAKQIYLLYRAGILTGNDSQGTYTPNANIQRSAVAALVTRMADKTLRETVTLEPAKASSFEVDFIDVGQADAALVRCDGKSMLIDGGNAADSNLIYSYLQKRSISYLDYIVCTHAHEDHVGGLAGALNYATVGTVYAPVSSYDSAAFGNFVTYLAKQNKTITVPKAGDSFTLGSATVTVLGPISASTEPNNTSIVLRIVYGDTSFLFTGDAEREEEQEILAAGYTLSSTVLKVGHHGSDSSTTYPFLNAIMPSSAVISVGTGNSYGHPDEDTLSRLRDADVKLYRTDLQGDIICVSDGKAVTITVSKNADADVFDSIGNNSTQPAESGTTTYILNTNTMKFHLPTCGSAAKISAANKSTFTGTREQLIAMGYSPCGNCKP